MKTHIAIAAVLLLVTAAPARAQQAMEVEVTDTTRRQIAAFEAALRSAIDSAAANLNRRVREAWPERQTMLAFERDKLVTGAWMPEGGAVFHVLIPKIQEIDLQLWKIREMRQSQEPSRAVRAGQGTAVNNSVVEPDPAIPPAPKGPPLTNPDVEYTQFTRAALLDAVLDGALALPIPAGKHLTVIADELLSDPSSPFVERSRTLILQISGEDLLALRQSKLSREDALARIKQYRY
jgi:hypothetical protein